MQNQGFEQWFKLSKSIPQPIGNVSKAANEIFRRTAQQNLELLSENLSRWSAQLKRLSNVKKPEDFINFQKDSINENISASIENAQKVIQLTMENMEEFTKLFSSSLHEPIFHAKKNEKENRSK